MRYDIRNPRANRARVFGLLEYARKTQDIEAFRAAQVGVATIGPGSKHSLRELFERTLGSVAAELTDTAMQDSDTATVVSFGRRVLEAPLHPTTFTRGTHHLMARNLHETGASGFGHETPYNGRIGSIKFWKRKDGNLAELWNQPTTLHLGRFVNGKYVEGGPVPILTETVVWHAFGERQIAVKDVDIMSVRLLPDETRHMLANLAMEITDNGNESGMLIPTPEETKWGRTIKNVQLPNN